MKLFPWNRNPNIGWWLDQEPIRLYHGTNIKNLPVIDRQGIKAPTSGSTAGWVSLAIEPYTSFGYASMSGAGGETNFRAAKAKPVYVPAEDRAILIIELPLRWMLQHMNKEMRGNIERTKNKLIDKDQYEKWSRFDHEYYESTEVRIGNNVPRRFIIGYTIKK